MAAEVSFSRVRDALRRSGFGGVALAPGAFPALHARAASGASPADPDTGPPDWAVLSYVQTNSPVGVGGVPTYVANEVEDVLDALLETRVLRHRALWMDVAAIGQAGFTAAGVLQCVGAPLIVVPPTRTKEYARYQVPDRWDEATYHSFVVLEDMMRACAVCGRFCPDEWDARLLNIAAALRAWPIIETILGSVARGAFISFESFDRYAYTVEWMQVLLHLALETGEYAPGLIDKSIELHGVTPNLKMLEDCISNLVAQAARFTLTHPEDRATLNLWSLPGLQRSPGEGTLWRCTNNESRLEVLAARRCVPTHDLRQIAANLLRGRPSEGSCMRHADKWTAAVVLSNLNAIVSVFAAPAYRHVLDKRAYRERMRSIFFYGAYAFGSFLPLSARYAVHMHPEMRKCKRAPKCTGKKALCLFNEHSGILPPTAAVRFLRDCGFSSEEMARISRDNLTKIQSGILVARVCYLAAWKAAANEVCCACNPNRRASSERRRLVLLGWDPTLRHLIPFFPVQRLHVQSVASQQQRQQWQQSQASVTPQQPVRVPQQRASQPESQTNTADQTPSNQKQVQKSAQERDSVHLTSLRNVHDGRMANQESSPKAESKPQTEHSATKSERRRSNGEVSKPEDAVNGARQSATSGTDEQTENRGKAGVRTESARPERQSTAVQKTAAAAAETRRRVANAQARADGMRVAENVRPVASSGVISYVVVDAAKMEHVVASGVDVLARAGSPSQCVACMASFMCVEMDNADESLEIHLDQVVQPRHAATRLGMGMTGAHDVFAKAL